MAEITAALTLDAGPAKATTDQLGASAQAAARQVDALSASHKNLVSASERASAVSATVVNQTKQETAAFLQRMQAFKDETARIREATQAQDVMAASSAKAATAHGAHALSLGRIETALGSFVGHALGVPPVIDRIIETFGGFALGGAIMAGALAGLAAIVTVWEKITEEAHAAEKAQDAALAKLEEWSHKRHLDSGGEFGEDVHGAGESLKRAVEEKVNVIGLQTAGGAAAGVATVWDFFRGKTKEGLDRAAQAVSDGRQMLGEETTKLFLDQRAKTSATLADNIKSNNLAHGERQRALAMLREDLALMAQYQKAGVTGELRTNLGRQIKELDEALNPKTKGAGGADAGMPKEIAAAMRDAGRAIDAFNKVRAEETAFADKSIANAKLDVDATRRMIEAYREGPAAVRQLTDELEIEAVTRDFLAKTKDLDAQQRADDLAALQAEIRARQQLGHVLADEKDAREQTTQARKKATDDAQRDAERAARQLQRATASAIEQGVEDFVNGADPFHAFAETMKRAIIRAIAEALAAGAIVRAAAALNTGISTGAHGGIADASSSMADAAFYQKLFKVGGAAVGGFALGNGIGQATGSGVAGAVGGAASGFMLGNAILPGLGGVVGGLAGFVGGILGAGDAARAAAERLRKAKEAFDSAFESAKAEVAGDQLAIQIAQVHAQYNALRDALKEATPWLQEFIGKTLGLGTYAEKLKEVNRLEQVRIEQLKEEAAAMSRYFSEDLEVEQQRARATIAESEGRTAEAAQMRKDADRTAYNQAQERRLEEYRRTHDMDDTANKAQYATLQNTVALNEQAFAVQQNTKAINQFTTSLHNAPTGFKYQTYTGEFGVPRAPNSIPLPVNPFRPPTTPLNPPSLNGSRTSSAQGGRSIVVSFAPVIDGTKATRTLAKDLAVEFKKVASEVLGSEADPADAIGLLAP